MASVAVIGVGTSYALFNSEPVTILASTASTGSANIAICNTDGDDTWKDSVSPELNLEGLAPGGPAVELTELANIYIGNDDGNLDDNALTNAADAPDQCSGSDGNSVVGQMIVPKITNPVCAEDADLLDELKLSFMLSNGTETPFQSLTDWQANDEFGIILDPTLAPDQAEVVTVMAKLDAGADVPNATCTFDMVFNGFQPGAEEATPTPTPSPSEEPSPLPSPSELE